MIGLTSETTQKCGKVFWSLFSDSWIKDEQKVLPHIVCNTHWMFMFEEGKFYHRFIVQGISYNAVCLMAAICCTLIPQTMLPVHCAIWNPKSTKSINPRNQIFLKIVTVCTAWLFKLQSLHEADSGLKPIIYRMFSAYCRFAFLAK